LNCISCGSHSGDGLLCPKCSGQDTLVPIFNLIGHSTFTEIRHHAALRIGIGPSAAGSPAMAPLPSLKQETDIIGRKLETGGDPDVLARRLERVLVNTGIPEEMRSGENLFSRECAETAQNLIGLGEGLRSEGAKFSPRAETLLGNLKWMSKPVFSGSRLVDSRSREDRISKDSGEILEHYRRATAKDSGYVPAIKNRALLLFTSGRFAEALDACGSLAERSPEDPYIWHLQGMAHLQLGYNEEAIRNFDSALRISSKSPEIWTEKGWALMKLEKYPEAASCFDRSIQLEPRNPEALTGKGDALTRTGQIALALEAYDRAKGMGPKPSFITRRALPPEKPEPILKTIQKEEAIIAGLEAKLGAEPAREPLPQTQSMAPETHIKITERKEARAEPREEHPPEKLAKEPVELKLEAELETVLQSKDRELASENAPAVPAASAEGPDSPDLEIPKPVEPAPVQEAPKKEKSPRSLAEMFIGGLTIPEEEEEPEEEEDEWPSLPDEVELPNNGNEDDEPILGPLMGVPNAKPAPETRTPDDEFKEMLGEIDEIEAGAAKEAESTSADALRKFIDREDYDEGLNFADKALSDNPDDAVTLALKGSILLSLDRAEEALEVLNRAIQKDPRHADAHVYRGRAYYDLEVYDKAFESFENAIRVETGNVEARLMMGECQLATEKYDDAIHSFSEVIELDKENTAAWLGIGDAFMGLDREDDASKCYEKVTVLDPGDPDGWSRMGDVLVIKGRWGGALQMYSRAIKVDAEYEDAYLKKATLLMKRNMVEEADAAYAQLLEVFPTHPDALNGRVECQIRRGKWGAALQSLKSVLRLHPDNAKAWALQGDAFREDGRVSEAKKPYDTALAMDPDDFTALLGKGRLMLDNGGYNEAIELFRKAIDIDPENSFVWRYLGDAQREIGKEKESLKSLEMSVDLGDNIPENWMAYGRALHESGRYPEAIECFDRVTKLSPNSQEAEKWREQSAKRLLKEAGH